MRHHHKKICIVSISLGIGGAERSSAILSQMLTGLGHDVHIVILNNVVDFDYAGTLLNLGSLKESSNTIVSRVMRFKKLRAYLKEQSFDIIIDHRTKTDYFKEYFYHSYVYKGLNRAYVVHSSNPDLYLTQYPNRFKNIYNKNLFTVGVSKYITEEILQKKGIRNCHTIYNAFDASWNEMNEELPQTLKDKKYILSYGRIEEEVKDFRFLIQSFTNSNVWQDGIYLVIMGEGKDKDALMKFALESPASEQILFLPYSKTPTPYILHAHCITLTSHFEGFPMVLVESLSLGVPVLSLDIISGPSEIVKHEKNGLLISKRSIPLFAEGIKRMCFDTELHEHCKQNAKDSVSQFSTDAISQCWNNLLQNEL